MLLYATSFGLFAWVDWKLIFAIIAFGFAQNLENKLKP